jgi:hypothetical protein
MWAAVALVSLAAAALYAAAARRSEPAVRPAAVTPAEAG